LVLLDTFAKGWSATIDGAPAPILRAFGLYRAVAVPEGAHQVVFKYVAPGLATGAIISLLSFVACASAVLTGGGRSP
jgi:uncharacterized membrane protein YfhO